MEYEELNEFAQKVKAGEITNFEPYFQHQNPDQLRTLKHICILHEAYQEAYLDWASDGRDTWIQHIEALYLKHAANKTEPTAIEKTMTPLQLYKVDSPLWTRPYTGEQVALVNQTLRDPLNDKTADLVFGAITAGAKTSGDLLDYMLNSRIQPTIP